MNQFILQQGHARELRSFPHILEFALKKNNSIQLNSLHSTCTDSMRIYFILDGKFEWIIGEQSRILYPGDLALVLPQQTFRGEKDILNIGTLSWIYLQIEEMDSTGMSLGKWSNLSSNECRTIGKILMLNDSTVLKLKECQNILQTLRQELLNQ
jgi:hypothetical protein